MPIELKKLKETQHHLYLEVLGHVEKWARLFISHGSPNYADKRIDVYQSVALHLALKFSDDDKFYNKLKSFTNKGRFYQAKYLVLRALNGNLRSQECKNDCLSLSKANHRSQYCKNELNPRINNNAEFHDVPIEHVVTKFPAPTLAIELQEQLDAYHQTM